MEDLLSTGIIAEEVLHFLPFFDGCKMARVCKDWRSACQSSFAWNKVDLVGFGADADSFLCAFPHHSRGIKVDVAPGCTHSVLCKALSEELSVIEIYSRRSDGSVSVPSGELSRRIDNIPIDGSLHIVLQEPATAQILSVLTKMGARIKTMMFLRGIEDVDVGTYINFLKSLKVVEELRLGACPSRVDFDLVVDSLLGLKGSLKRLQAESLNIGLLDLKRLVGGLESSDVVCEITGMQVLALFAGLI